MFAHTEATLTPQPSPPTRGLLFCLGCGCDFFAAKLLAKIVGGFAVRNCVDFILVLGKINPSQLTK
ncbi:MAG: hypothetical protein IKZ87_01395 [Actinomycetaceae bacterium]|nr:hypothetical protein [Actinomycetaceae bacterium]